MGIPRKRSRWVDVEGKRYLFLVKEGHIPDHKDQRSSTVVIQEFEEKPGRVLRARFFYGVEITPALVKGLVAEGRKLGWNPADRGGAFDLPADRASGRFHEGDVASYRGPEPFHSLVPA